MKKYTDNEGNKVVEVDDLSFLSDREHYYNWFQTHYHHLILRTALRKADVIIAADQKIAEELIRYYPISRNKIRIR